MTGNWIHKSIKNVSVGNDVGTFTQPEESVGLGVDYFNRKWGKFPGKFEGGVCFGRENSLYILHFR